MSIKRYKHIQDATLLTVVKKHQTQFLILWTVIIVLMTMLVYIPAMRGGFVWDDDRFLTNNSLIKADDGLYRFWFTTEAPDYFPLVSSSLWLEWRLWGMNAAGYHVVNVMLHAVSAVLVWLVLKRLNIPGAWLSGLIFAIHTVNVESVAWITERKNTLSMVFYLLSIMAYLQFEIKKYYRWFFLSLGAFLLALFSKTSVVMLPFVLLGCAWWQRGRICREDLLRSVPFFMLSGILSLVTVWFQYTRNIGDDLVRNDNFLSRLAGAGWAVWFYLSKAIVPHKLTFVYPRWQIDAFSITSYLPLLMLLICFMLFWRYQRTWGRPLLFGLGYYVVTLMPVLGFLDIYFMRYSLVADHWQYISIVGIIALVVGLGFHIAGRWRDTLQQLAALFVVILVVLLSSLTWQQGHIYKDEETLWRDTINKNPAAWMAYTILGNTYMEEGLLNEALTEFRDAVRVDPDNAVTHTNLGFVYKEKGLWDQAVAEYREALQIDPNFVLAHNNLGVAYAERGIWDEAIAEYREAMRVNPAFAEAHYNLGIALKNLGQFSRAEEEFRETIRLAPDHFMAHNNLGNISLIQKRYGPAIKEYQEALRLSPMNIESIYNLAIAFERLGDLKGAMEFYKRFIEVAPQEYSVQIEGAKESIKSFSGGRMD